LWTLRADGSDPEVIGSFVPTYVEVMTDFFPSGYCGMQFPLAGDGAPRWSQDGKHVLITDGGDPPTVYIVERDGNHDPVQVGVGYSAGWSPNGEHITFVRECKVHVVPFDGADTGDDGVTIDGYRYDWRDDGNLLVRQSSLGPGTVPETMAIYDPSGQRLASYPEALLSPNGDLIATLETIVLETGAREWTTTIRATASGQVLRTLEHVNHVTFSPNGRWIAYEAGPCCQMTMWVLDLSNPGSSPVLVVAGRGSRGRVWSPDSNKLAFTHRITEGSSNDILAVFDLESGSTHTIAEDATAPQWFPDSERLLFVTNFR
jgi:Tol biopolymer transport system component